MAVDPGLNGTGWATFQGRKLVDQGVLTFRDEKLAWEERAIMYASSIRSLSIHHKVDRIACEYPAFFESAAGTMVAKKGDLLKLTSLVGLMWGVVYPLPFLLVPVNQWKGQLPKEVVNRRITAKLGEKACAGIKSHAWDAVGIGLYVNGDFA
jgi:hypothetical protein